MLGGEAVPVQQRKSGEPTDMRIISRRTRRATAATLAMIALGGCGPPNRERMSQEALAWAA